MKALLPRIDDATADRIRTEALSNLGSLTLTRKVIYRNGNSRVLARFRIEATEDILEAIGPDSAKALKKLAVMVEDRIERYRQVLLLVSLAERNAVSSKE